MNPRSTFLALLALSAGAMAAHADTVTLTPIADAFVAASNPTSNYGGAGVVSVAAPNLPRGEFQGVMRFDTSSAVSSFDAAFGAGHWTITSVTLRLVAMNPANQLFNGAGAGEFRIDWTPNDNWTEGTGMPNSPGATGITYATLPDFLDPGDQSLGTFAFDGAISGAVTYTLAPTANFRADIASGGPVGLHFAPVGSTIACLFNSRNFNNPANWPQLAITADAIAPCPADFNGVGGLSVQDIFDYLSAWFAADPRADFNHSGGPSVQDIFDFLGAWFAGCP